ALLTSAEFGQGPPGVNGPTMRPLYTDETMKGQSADAVWKTSDADPLTTEAMGAMFRGDIYFDINTTAFPLGEIRGQLGWPIATVTVEPPSSTGTTLQLGSAPNPTRDRTFISYYLPQRTDMRLTVYDVTGAQIAQLMRNSNDINW